MVKGVGIVDQALREAFQILKQVLPLRKPRESGGMGDSLKVWGGQLLAYSHGATPPLHSSKRPGKEASATKPSC